MRSGQELSKKDVQSPEVIVLYTASPWESAVVVLRVTAPAERAGLKVIKGNQGDRVSPELVSEADVVTASCPALADYLRMFNPNTRVLANYLDDQTWDFRKQDEYQIGDFP